MGYVYARTYQWFMSMAFQCIPQRMPILSEGAGSLLEIPNLLKKEKIDKVELVTTAGFIKRGSLEGLIQKLEKEKIGCVIYSDVNSDPTIANIEDAVKVYQDNHCKAIVAIGGGSVIDCAKVAAARVAKPNKSIRKMAGVLKIREKLPILFAVPTTAGTGSEVTAGAVVTDETNHYKVTVLDLCLVPWYTILDPELTYSLPKTMTAYSGMDALSHAVEAYVNRFRSKLARESALKGVKLIYHNLLKAYEDGQNKEARKNMLKGSYYAGLAINNAYIGYAHAIGHGVGGLYGVPHGKAVGVLLPIVLRQYGKSCYKELAELADAVGVEGKNQEEKALRFIEGIEALLEHLELPRKLDVVRKEDIPELIRRAKKEVIPTYPVPVIWNEEDIKRVIEKL